MAAPSNPATPSPATTSATNDLLSFRPKKSITQIAAEQGIAGPLDLDALFASGVDLWDGDAEFEEFQAWLRDSRREDR